MRLNIHAGHNPDGKVACGAVGLLKESTENRIVKNKVVSRLKEKGHTVYDCTCDNGASQRDVLNKIVAKCNAHAVDLDVSIHFNAGAKKTGKNGKTTGTEVFVYSKDSKAVPYAKRICNEISSLGFSNRGVKVNPDLYVLKNSKAPALLIECCFVDDPDDVALYNAATMAEAIVNGITDSNSTYIVRTPANTAVYSRSDKKSDISMVIKKAGSYTIVKEKNGFGYLKSGAGWIELSKAERI